MAKKATEGSTCMMILLVLSCCNSKCSSRWHSTLTVVNPLILCLAGRYLQICNKKARTWKQKN